MNVAGGSIARLVLWASLLLSVSGRAGAREASAYGEVRAFGAAAAYGVDSTLLLNDATRSDKELGYKLRALLQVAPAWALPDDDSAAHQEFLLKFDLVSPQLLTRGVHMSSDFLPHTSSWDSYPHTTFYAHWKNGHIVTPYLDLSEPVDILNYKRTLISLFQFHAIDGEHNETDFSGTCTVSYESLSMHVIRKFKSSCWEEDSGSEGAGEDVQARRLTRYSLSAALDALEEVYAEEVVEVGGDGAGGWGAVKARAWQRLQRRAQLAVPAPAAAAEGARGSLAAALAALPPALAPAALRLQRASHRDPFHDDEEPGLAAALAAGGAALGGGAAGAGGAADEARAALRLLPALRRAPRPALHHLLQREIDPQRLAGLCRLLGLAGAVGAHGAAAAFLQLREREPLTALAHQYLGALALAAAPHEDVLADVLQLGEDARTDAALAESALLAVAAAATRVPAAENSVRDSLVRSLNRCKEEACRAVRLRALGNLRRGDTAELLLQHAERAAGARAGGEAALAALGALRALPAAALLRAPLLERLFALALNARASDVRAAALELAVVRSAGAPLGLARVALALPAHEPELRRVFWQRLRALAPEHEAVRRLLALLPARLRTWDAQATGGTSSVLVREAGGAEGWGAGGGHRRARLDSLQVARGGLLRRGRVQLDLVAPDNSTEEAFAVELWTRGLESFAGSVDDSAIAEDEQEEASGGLAVSVGGARMRGLTLFNGQAELLGHVWAGAGSSPTPVARALRPLPVRAGSAPLVAGARLYWRRSAALAVALDAQAQVSLWSRSARTVLELRGALAGVTEVCAGEGEGEGEGGATGTVRGAGEVRAQRRLRIAADLDFYDGVALCVRVSLGEAARAHNCSLAGAAGAPAHRVRRGRGLRARSPPRTLSLGAPNDAACRALGSRDD